jgi:hypothetical protein
MGVKIHFEAAPCHRIIDLEPEEIKGKREKVRSSE